jgi:beta-glucosidase
MDRPAILTNIREKVQAILVSFGVSDESLLHILAGRAQAEGRLPFELPSSMAAVEAQSPGLPHDSREPLYRIGTGGPARPSSARDQVRAD